MKNELTKICVLMPNDVLKKIDAAAANAGSSREWFILSVLETAISDQQTDTDDDRLSAIEAKLDALLTASQVASAAFRHVSKTKTPRQ